MDLRCFIAIELPPQLKDTIHGLTGGLRDSGARVKWVPAANLHLTLKFLGNVPEEIIPDIRDRLAGVSALHPVFTLDFRGAGAFPDLRRPRVVWAGVLDSDALTSLQRDVEEAMGALGFAPEGKTFSPHLTLGRVKSPGGLAGLRGELAALRETFFGSVRVQEVSLMKSELSPSGAHHERLFGAALSG